MEHYMDFNKIPVVLKRYSFKEKMRICNNNSRLLIDINGLTNIDKLNGKALPWELETFALLALISNKEYDNQTFITPKKFKQFTNIINCIKSYTPPKLLEDTQSIRFIENLLIVLGNTQFQVQEYAIYKLFRYNYFFNFKNKNIDMILEFKKKFNTNYSEFILFAWFFNFLNSPSNKNIDPTNIYAFFFNKYSQVFSNLVKNRDDLIKLQSQVSLNIDDYHYCFKYFYQFPFIEHENSIYFPLPHLIYQATTSSLLFRLTENNKPLRDTFGKEILENYLFDITQNSFVYDEIVPEKVYRTKKGDIRSLDLMIRQNDMCILIDIKSMIPRRDIRLLNYEIIQQTISKISNQIISLYRHIKNHFCKSYCPFTDTQEFEQKNIFGLIVMLEDSYIIRESIIKDVCIKLDIEENSEEFKWLSSNIRIISLYEYEQVVFNNENLFKHLVYLRDNPSTWYNFGIVNSENNSTVSIQNNVVISDFIDNLTHEIKSIVQELIKQGLVSK